MLTSQVSVKPGFRQEAAALRAAQRQPDRREPEFPCVLLVLMLKLLVTVPVSSWADESLVTVSAREIF